jgi:hypothetical protein
VAVLGDHDRKIDLLRKAGEDAADGVEPTPRSADGDEAVHGYVTFR